MGFERCCRWVSKLCVWWCCRYWLLDKEEKWVGLGSVGEWSDVVCGANVEIEGKVSDWMLLMVQMCSEAKLVMER